ncbi:MAG: FGGY-family carbohydrate kinase [Pseudomonadota bacterium]
MTDLSLGVDLGTSGIRSAVLDAEGRVISMARAEYGNDTGSAETWWDGASRCILNQLSALRAGGIDQDRVRRIGVDGTSGSMVLTDEALKPVTRPLLYNASGFLEEAQNIDAVAPASHITRGPGSALARALRLLSEDGAERAQHLLHQADFIAARLMGYGGLSDHNNALKTGFDPEAGGWPDWFAAFGRLSDILPDVRPAGIRAGPIHPEIAEQLGLSKHVQVHLGTTDSIAAFLASAPMQIGMAVTSLGTTLAVKIMSDHRIDVPEIGLYSHKLGNSWLVGGASNTGGGVLLELFTTAQLEELSTKVDPTKLTTLDYYPLSKPGERFPVNDPNFAPRIEPRPESDVDFLHGLLDGIARIEAQCYAEISKRGAPRIDRLFTAGGGAKNPTWTKLRERRLGLKIEIAERTEAAIGTARLISQAT